MSLTALRQAVQDELQSDLGIEFHGGTRTGPSEDRDVGFVWINTLAPGDGLEQAVDVRVRVFLQYKPPTSLNEPDPAALEDLAERVQSSLMVLAVAAAVQSTGFWFLQQVAEMEIDYAAYGLEASVIALRTNPFLA